MEISKTTISFTSSANAAQPHFIIGEKIKASVITHLGNGFYLVNVKGKEIKVKSYVPLKDVEVFIVEKTGKQVVLRQEVSTHSYDVERLISGFPQLSQVNDPLLRQILSLFLKKNLKLDENSIYRLYRVLKEAGAGDKLPANFIRFLINLSEEGIPFNSLLVKTLLDYEKFLAEKKEKFKNEDYKKFFADNKKEKFFSNDEIKRIYSFLKDTGDLLKHGKDRGAYYFLFPFMSDEEKFFAELKVFFEKNEQGEKDYGFAVNLHFTAGEVRIRGNKIQSQIYTRLFFENEKFLDFCKEQIIQADFPYDNIRFFMMAECVDDEEALFSDIYYKDEQL